MHVIQLTRLVSSPRKQAVRYGFIAQDVLDVLPDLVIEVPAEVADSRITKDEAQNTLKKTGKKEMRYSMDYQGILAPLVKAVQELKQIVDGVIEDVKKLAARVDEAFTKLAAHDDEIKKLKDENEALRAAVCKIDATASFCHSFKSGFDHHAIVPAS